MGEIKTTISLETSTILKSTFTANATVSQEVNGDSDAKTVNITPGKDLVVFGPTKPVSTQTTYLYISSISSGNVEVYLQDTNEVEILVAVIGNGEFMWLPLATYGGNIKVTCANLDPVADATLKVFWGSKN